LKLFSALAGLVLTFERKLIIIIIIIIIVAKIKVTLSHKNVAGELYKTRCRK